MLTLSKIYAVKTIHPRMNIEQKNKEQGILNDEIFNAPCSIFNVLILKISACKGTKIAAL
jgi:hypothetical protein